jgi:hypothetical protein
MKRAGFFVIAIIILAARPESTERISIENAVKKGLISVEATSLGGHSGEVVALTVKPIVKKSFQLYIPAGTHFIPNDEGDQNIFVVKDQEEMIANNEIEIEVEGFCSESNDRSPSAGSGFKVIHSKEQKLLKLADYMRDKDFPSDVKQSAVWAVSDNSSVSYISDDEHEKEITALRTFISELTGQPNVWYTTERHIEILEDRTIEASPVKVRGDIEYKVARPGKMTAGVYGANDNEIFTLGDGMKLPQAGEYSFFFNLKVTGWKTGGYKVKVFIDGNPIHVQNFEV